MPVRTFVLRAIFFFFFWTNFYSRGRVEYPAPWGGIRVFNPDCNTF